MLEIGTVRMKNVSDDFKGLEGMKLLLMHSCEGCERIVVNPIRQEDFEKYYKNSFETMGKEWVNDDYKSFLKYMLSENCEFI
ncbi:hypothetical protein CLPU_57c00030, partial [Gottschalkia purinilytica]